MAEKCKFHRSTDMPCELCAEIANHPSIEPPVPSKLEQDMEARTRVLVRSYKAYIMESLRLLAEMRAKHIEDNGCDTSPCPWCQDVVPFLEKTDFIVRGV